MRHLIPLLLLATACGPAHVPMSARGEQGDPGQIGATGPAGAPGPSGPSGAPGQSCSVVQVPEGAVISCPDGTSAVIEHGRSCKNKGKNCR
jgi:hypothetical protein